MRIFFEMSNFDQSIMPHIFSNTIDHFCSIFYIILEKLKDSSICLVPNFTILRCEWCYCDYTVQLFPFAKMVNIILQLFLNISQKLSIRFIETNSIRIIWIAWLWLNTTSKNSPIACFWFCVKIYASHFDS